MRHKTKRKEKNLSKYKHKRVDKEFSICLFSCMYACYSGSREGASIHFLDFPQQTKLVMPFPIAKQKRTNFGGQAVIMPGIRFLTSERTLNFSLKFSQIILMSDPHLLS